MHESLIFLFSQTALVGAFQAFTLAVVILGIRHFNLMTLFLIAYICIHGIRLLLLYFLFGEIQIDFQYIFLLLALGYALGPLLYFYTKTLTQQHFYFSNKDWLHLMPVPLSMAVCLLPVMRAEGVDENIFLWFNAQASLMIWHLDWILPILLNVSIIIYSLLAIYLLVQHQHRLGELFSSRQGVSLQWLWVVLSLSLLGACLSTFGYLMRWLWAFELGPRLYIWLMVNLLQLFVIAIMGMRQQFIFTGWSEEVADSVLREEGQNKKYQRSGLTERESQARWEELQKLMREEKPYLSCTLNLQDLARQMKTSLKHLSQVINTHSGGKFFDYINDYRLDYAKSRMAEEPTTALLDIALESGFSSQSVFSSRFRKQLGQSPSEYRKALLQEKSLTN